MRKLLLFVVAGLLIGCGGKKEAKKDPWDEYAPKVQAKFDEAVSKEDTAALKALTDSLYAFYKSHDDSTSKQGRKKALYFACNWSFAAFDWDRVLKYCGEFVTRYPGSVKAEEAYRFIGFALLQQKRWDDVIKVMETFIRDYPESSNLGYAYKYLGIALSHKGRYDEAKKALKKAKTMLEVLGAYDEIQEIDDMLKKLGG
ncbi:MAG: outer membrane protein assembly factor BamD [Thermotogae bacterium]|nr:outer membrane protein assembly factor BamD [Thermotogota bacterium]